MKVLHLQDALTGKPILVRVVEANGHTVLGLGRSYEGLGIPATSLGEDGDTYRDTHTDTAFLKLNGRWAIVANPDPNIDSVEKVRKDFRTLLTAWLEVGLPMIEGLESETEAALAQQ